MPPEEGMISMGGQDPLQPVGWEDGSWSRKRVHSHSQFLLAGHSVCSYVCACARAVLLWK